MHIITDPQELRLHCQGWRRDGLTTGLVPTMGYLHEGHMALMRHARQRCDRLAVSIFLNPTQFAPGEDLDKYPSDPVGDRAKAEACGADVLFMPAPGAMYAPDHATWIDVPDLGRHLCGASRPGHFRGVCTVVAKLFMLARPDVAVFGRKDWQQLAILRRMVRDLDFPVEMIGHDIVREEDGLAMSSRNAYLTPEERAAAPAIHRGLVKLAEMIHKGERDPEAATRFLRDEYARELPMGVVDYAELVHPDHITPVATLSGPVLAAVAVQVGRARLIDNMLIEV
jgi:pantoate--beta-alanine ligase